VGLFTGLDSGRLETDRYVVAAWRGDLLRRDDPTYGLPLSLRALLGFFPGSYRLVGVIALTIIGLVLAACGGRPNDVVGQWFSENSQKSRSC
jgi:hypothetical protein